MSSAINTTAGNVVEVIAAYSASNQQIPGVAAAPAWVVIGAFYMPMTSDVRLEAIASVSDAGLVLTCRLFDVDGAAPVSGSDTPATSSTVDGRMLSGAFALPGGKVYQVQAQCIGNSGESAIIRSASLV